MLDSYIEECITGMHTVNIITVNGYQMKCKILHEELEYVVVLEGNKKKMIYKHAISTIEPADKKNNS